MSGCHSAELISPGSLQGFRLAKAPGSWGCNASRLRDGEFLPREISARPSHQIPTRPVSHDTWRKALHFGYTNGTDSSSSLSPYIHPSRCRNSQPRNEAEWDHGVGCGSLRAMGLVGGHMWNLGQGHNLYCWKSNLWLSFPANPQASCAGGPRKKKWVYELLPQSENCLKASRYCKTHMNVSVQVIWKQERWLPSSTLHWPCPLAKKKRKKCERIVVCEGVSSFLSHCLFRGLKKSSMDVMWEHRKEGSAT